VVYKGSLFKEFGRAFGAVGGLVGGPLAEAQQADKNVLYAASFADVKKVSAKKTLLTGSPLDFEMSNGDSINFAGNVMSLGWLKKCLVEVSEIIRRVSPALAVE
jgi:hypothetical protein